MDFTFLKASGEVAFFRSDAEEASWTQEELSLRCTFPYIPEKVIERGMVILFQDPATDAWQAFNIRQCVIMPGAYYQQITGEDIAITELSACLIQDKIEMTDISVISALSQILTGTGWSIGATVSSVSSGDISRGSVWEAVSAVAQNWNVYIMPRVTVGPDGITGRYLDIISTQGVDRGLRLAIDKNMSDPCVTYDDSELFTALYGYGGTYSEGSGSSKVTLEYNFSSVSWAKTPDHPAKPAGQRYLEYPEMTALYGLNGRPRFGYYQNTDINDPNVLLEKTWETLKEVCKPKISISGTVRDLKRMGYADIPLRLHDMAVIELEPVGLLFYKQVTRLTVDLLDPSRDTPEIGDYIPNIIYINRETESFATGGSKGSGKNKNRTKIDLVNSEFRTDIYDNGRQVGMLAVQVDEHGNILNQAGMEIDPETGVLIYAEGKDNMIGSMFHVQKNMIESEVHQRQQGEAELSSRITQTANAISLEVSERISAEAGLSGRITVNANKVGLVVEEKDGHNVIKSASIVTSINNSGSSVAISADHVNIDGNVKLSGCMDIQDGNLRVTRALLISGSTSNVTINNGTVQSKSYQVNSGGGIKFVGAGAGEYYDLTASVLMGMVKNFSVENNVLTLTPFYGEPVTFSKGTLVSGGWSANTYSATSSPTGSSSVSTTVNLRFGANSGVYYVEGYRSNESGGPSISNCSITYKLARVSNQIQIQNTSDVQIPNTAVYTLTAHNNCVAGLTRAMVNGNVIHDKLYYKDGSIYKEVVNSEQYWYYKTANSSLTTYYS